MVVVLYSGLLDMVMVHCVAFGWHVEILRSHWVVRQHFAYGLRRFCFCIGAAMSVNVQRLELIGCV